MISKTFLVQRSILASVLLRMAACISIIGCQSVEAGQVALAWTASSSSSVAGYKTYYGTASGAYTSSVDSGKTTSVSVTSLQDGLKYYFAVVAYDASGNKSAYSNEVAATLPAVANAAFSASATSVNAVTSVTLIPSFTGTVTAWKWDFGDGSAPLAGSNSVIPQATKSYAKSGTFTVTLTVGSLTQSKVINVLPVAAFSVSSSSGTAPLAVSFTDNSVGSPTSWTWNFGDGSSSNAQSPSHSFSAAGTYSVSLSVASAGLSSLSPVTKTITVASSAIGSPGGGAASVQNLVAGYSFEEGTGSITGDSSVYANTGTLTNGPAWVAGKFGKALSFGGKTSVKIPNSSPINISGSAITVSFFAKITDYGRDQVLVGKPRNAAFSYPWYQYGVEYTRSSKMLSFYLSDTNGAPYQYDMPAPLGVWAHVAFTYDGANVRGYIDGVQKFAKAATFKLVASETPLTIGLDPLGNQPTNGALDEVRIYDVAQSATAIAADMAKSAVAASPLMAAYAFDEAAGSKVVDASGNGNTGVLVNSPAWQAGRFGNGLRFGGASYVSVASSSSLTGGGSALTLSFYANITDYGKDQVLIGKPANSSFSYPWYQYGVEFTASTKTLSLYLSDTNGVAHQYDMPAPLGIWSHLAFVYDGETVKGYANGVLKLTGQANFKLQGAATPLRIGLDPIGSQPTNGAVDEVRIFGAALNSTAIQRNLASGVNYSSPAKYLGGYSAGGDAVFPLPLGVPYAYSVTVTRTGVMNWIPVFVDSSSAKSKIGVGVYTDNAGHPGALISCAWMPAAKVGAWNFIPLQGTSVISGKKYWLAILNPAIANDQVLYLRNASVSDGRYLEKGGLGLQEKLPSTWVIGQQTVDGPLSLYGAGY